MSDSTTTLDPFAAATFTPYVKWYRVKAKVATATGFDYPEEYRNSLEDANALVAQYWEDSPQYVFFSRCTVIDAEGNRLVENMMQRDKDGQWERRLDERLAPAKPPVRSSNSIATDEAPSSANDLL